MAVVCRCGVPVIRLLRDAMPLTLDADPINELGELDALLQGEITYAMYGSNVIKRTVREIETYPNPLGGSLYRAHVCHRPVPEPLRKRFGGQYEGDPGF
jgi:hypothetical protein